VAGRLPSTRSPPPGHGPGAATAAYSTTAAQDTEAHAWPAVTATPPWPAVTAPTLPNSLSRDRGSSTAWSWSAAATLTLYREETLWSSSVPIWWADFRSRKPSTPCKRWLQDDQRHARRKPQRHLRLAWPDRTNSHKCRTATAIALPAPTTPVSPFDVLISAVLNFAISAFFNVEPTSGFVLVYLHSGSGLGLHSAERKSVNVCGLTCVS
jgi:hypothetical protein